MKTVLKTLSLEALTNVYNDAARKNKSLRIFEFKNHDLAVERTLRMLTMAQLHIIPAKNSVGYAVYKFPLRELRGDARVIRKTGRAPSGRYTEAGLAWDKLKDGDSIGEFRARLGRNPLRFLRNWKRDGLVHVLTYVRVSKP